MIRSIVLTVLLTLLFSADVSSADMRDTLPTGTGKGEGQLRLPPGPHFILTIPVTLLNIPPEVDQYEVNCAVYAHPHRVVGHGTASGTIPNTGGRPGVDFKTDVVVGVAVTEGDMATLESVWRYGCRLYLRGTAYGVTTNYLADDYTSTHLTDQQGQSLFPLAPGAPFNRAITRGQIPGASKDR